MATSAVAVFARGPMRRARSAIVTPQSASSPTATAYGAWPTRMGDSEVYRGCSDSDRPDDFVALIIDARDRSIVCVGDPDRAVPDRDGDGPSAYEHVAHYPGALRVDHSDRVGRNRRLGARRRSATLRDRGPFGSRDYRRLERRIVVEDRFFEALELIVRLKSELLVQPPPPHAVDLERVCLAAAAIEAQHELAAQTLAQRVLANE